MKMQEISVLTDCLESLKHVAERYQEALFECDNDHVRDTLQDIMIDRVEQQASIFSLMHQMGMIKTAPADQSQVDEVLATYKREAAQMEARHKAVEGAHATPPKSR